jgi:hypothetical protein
LPLLGSTAKRKRVTEHRRKTKSDGRAVASSCPS